MCLGYPDSDYCHRCIGEGASHHDATHRFEIFNKAVYFASAYTRFSIDHSIRMFPRTNFGDIPLLGAVGSLVDTIQGIEEPNVSEIRRHAKSSEFRIPLERWLTLAGKERWA